MKEIFDAEFLELVELRQRPAQEPLSPEATLQVRISKDRRVMGIAKNIADLIRGKIEPDVTVYVRPNREKTGIRLLHGGGFEHIYKPVKPQMLAEGWLLRNITSETYIRKYPNSHWGTLLTDRGGLINYRLYSEKEDSISELFVNQKLIDREMFNIQTENEMNSAVVFESLLVDFYVDRSVRSIALSSAE